MAEQKKKQGEEWYGFVLEKGFSNKIDSEKRKKDAGRINKKKNNRNAYMK